jgi:four helix bundle protein
MTKFRTYDLAVDFYKSCRNTQLPYYLKNQLLRAASSCALNLKEGSAKRSKAERKKYFGIAYASLKECQCVFDLEPEKHLSKKADILAAHLYKLHQSI